jgi:hypothetical protein
MNAKLGVDGTDFLGFPEAPPRGTRLPAVERQADDYFDLPTCSPAFSPERRVELFSKVVEPSLQRELRHKGAASGDGSYSVEMIGYLEIV